MIQQRGIIELDGEWRLKLDPDGVGLGSKWTEGLQDGESVEVNRPWEYWHPNYDGIGWYEKTVVVPADWAQGSQIAIEFDAVSYYAEAWLNGEYLGSHEGGFTTFELDATNAANPGQENRLVVRVINPPTDREIEGFRAGAPLNQSDIPIGKSAWYYNFGGIWQGVRLIRRPLNAIKALRVFPNLETSKLRVDIVHLDAEDTINLEARVSILPLDGGEPIQEATFQLNLEEGESRSTVEISSDGLQLWDLENPVRYKARVELLHDGALIDALDQTFGVREFTIRDEHFSLNGKPVFLNGFLHQGHYPRNLTLPEDREFARNELLEVKRRGFNFIRITMKPAPHWYLEMADEIGLFVMHEPPIGWIANGPRTRERCMREARELAERDSNHPSVVIVGLFNESFHLLGFDPQEVLDITREMALVSREIDPSRLIIDTSGGFSKKVLSGPDTMIHDSGASGYQISRAMLPWKSEFMEIFDIHKYCRFPATSADIESYRKLPSPGQLLFIAEYGAPETPPDYDSVLAEYTAEEAERQLEDWKVHRDFSDSLKQRFEQSGLGKHIASVNDFIAAIGKSMATDNRQIAHSIRCNPHVSGMCFCQLADASGELFGVTDVWRRPKPLYDALSNASANPAVGVQLSNRVLAEGDPVGVHVSLTADHGYRYQGKVTVSIAQDSGASVWSTEVDVPESTRVRAVLDTTLDLTLTSGLWRATARFTGVDGKVNEDNLEFRVIAPADREPRHVAMRDADGRIEAYLRKAGWKIDTFGNNYRGKNTPILLNMEPLPKNRAFYGELYGQLSKIVRLGGCAVLFEPEVHALYEYLFPTFLRPQPVMRTCPYALEHPIFRNLPSGGIVDYAYAEMFPGKWDSGEDILNAGGEVLFGAFSMHMWTRPAAYFWGAGLYRIPIGRGNVIVCHLPVAGAMDKSPLGPHLINNLVDYANSLIKEGGEEHLLARCIDPLPEDAVQ